MLPFNQAVCRGFSLRSFKHLSLKIPNKVFLYKKECIDIYNNLASTLSKICSSLKVIE